MNRSRTFYITLVAFMLALAGVVSLTGSAATRPASAYAPADQTAGPAQQPLKPLESLLNADGTLDLQAGYTGNLDPKGWHMVNAPGDKPRFVRDTPDKQGEPVGALLAAPSAGDENWDRRFAPLGVSWYASAIAITGNDVYVGGDFTTVGDLDTCCIGRWNAVTQRWYPLGSGVEWGVEAIIVLGTDVYVGGDFTTAGGAPANRIARWDTITQQWHTLGSGVSGPSYQTRVITIEAVGTDIYVGGYFTSAGGVPANNIARWNTITGQWHALGDGVAGEVYDIASLGADVYAGGEFGSAGGTPANNIARWSTATGQWHPLGDGVHSPIAHQEPVSAIATVGTDVYVGGDFTMAGGQIITNIARWDTITGQWRLVGAGLWGVVRDISVSGNNLYVGGDFLSAGGKAANHVARLDTASQQWYPLGTGTDGGYENAVYALAITDSYLYAAGDFATAGGVGLNNVARWNTTNGTWHPLNSGPNTNGATDWIEAIAVSGSDVYVGGSFLSVGDVPANEIARWDTVTNRWYPLGDGMSFEPSGEVAAIAISGTDVYVGGGFLSAGGGYNIARWDSAASRWYPLGYGTNNTVYDIAIVGNDVYAGGAFTTAGLVTANHIARWNTITQQWYPIIDSGGRNGVNATVFAITAGNSHLSPAGSDPTASQFVYVGGYFTSAGGTVARHVARWDSVNGQWSALGSGVGGVDYPVVYDIAVEGADVYVGGIFVSAGGVGASHIARWDTLAGQWYPLGDGVRGYNDDFYVWDVTVAENDVYVGGGFTTAGGAPAKYIARWNTLEQQWHSLGSGMDDWVLAIAPSGNNLYVGGFFGRAGNKTSAKFGIYHLPCPMSFTDVQPSDYFYSAVQYLYCRDIVSGYTDNTFHPYNNTTRAQLCKIVSLAEGWPLENPARPHFTDVPTTHPFYTYIETAYAQGVISGYDDGTFLPSNNVTRAQLCKVVVLSEEWEPQCPTTGHFSDVPSTHPFYCSIETAYAHGVIVGYSDGLFRPGNPATRGQISKIVYQAVTQP